jgi:hypothetical protein
MPLTGAEKQRRYIQRAAAGPLQEPRDSAEVARLLAIAARVRRAMPRKADVMELCDAVEGPARTMITEEQRAQARRRLEQLPTATWSAYDLSWRPGQPEPQPRRKAKAKAAARRKEQRAF